METDRGRPGVPLRCEWATGSKQLQGRRVFHRERAAREEKPEAVARIFSNGVFTISCSLIIFSLNPHVISSVDRI